MTYPYTFFLFVIITENFLLSQFLALSVNQCGFFFGLNL